MKKVTGKVTPKRYQCQTCQAIEIHSTNHYGEIYPRCRSCGWKHPMDVQVFKCLEPLPEGWLTPEPWKICKLGDLVTIEELK
jgi:hypothetical protein